MRKRRVRKALVALATAGAAALMVVPAAPAAAQPYDCQFAGPYVVDDAFDCVYYIIITAVG